MAVAEKGYQIRATKLPQEWLRDAIVCIDSHTGGEPTRLVVGGIPEISGDNVREKTRFFADYLDHLRTTLTGEPRAHQAMHALVLCPATSDEADFGVIIMCALGYLDMCGHALIGAVTSVLEAGIIKAAEPETVVTVETPAGIMRTRAHVVNGKVLSVTFRNQPAFVYKQDLEVCVEPFGKLNVDIAYGGLWYVIAKADQVSIALDPSNLDRLSHASRSILKAVNSAILAETPHPRARWRFTTTAVYRSADEPGSGRQELYLVYRTGIRSLSMWYWQQCQDGCVACEGRTRP